MEGGLCVWMGKQLLDRMSRIVSSSFLYSSSFKLYVCSLLYKNLAAAYLCWAGWFEEYGMIVSVKVGFLCMEITQFVRDHSPCRPPLITERLPNK